MNNKGKCFALGLLRILGGIVALVVCLLSVIGYYTHTDAGGPMLIFCWWTPVTCGDL